MSSKKLFQYLFVENFFTESELASIWAELDVFHEQKLFDYDNTGPSTLNDVSLASKTGFFLQTVVPNSVDTAIHKACSKIFQGPTNEFANLDFTNELCLETNQHSTLLSLYGDKDGYKTHSDCAVTSVLFWLCREPKKFQGGDLVFPQIKETIKFKNNSMLMFPSQAKHKVTEVTMDPNLPKKYGRYCFTMFLNIS